jgi:hypothetical protein
MDTNIKKLYVRFAGDNNFCHTVEAFVKAIAPRIFYDSWHNISKKEIVDLFNYSASPLYHLHQNYNQSIDEKGRYESYLQIEEKDVMFNEEIDEFIYSGQTNGDGCLAYLNHKEDIECCIM